MQGNLACAHLPALVLHRHGERQRTAFKPFKGTSRSVSSVCRSKKADADLQLVKREETSDGAILFVFGDEAAVAANKSAEPADSPAPAQEPEAAYEAVRAEKVEKGAAAAGEEAAALSNGAVVPDFSEDPDPDELLSDEDAPDLQDEIAKTLTSLRVADLKEMCKERKITGYSKMRKSQLVRVLKDAMLVDSE